METPRRPRSPSIHPVVNPGPKDQADALAMGWDAIGRGAFAEAQAAFEQAIEGKETAEGREGLSWAAWYQDDARATFEARERAYTLFRRRGDRASAARMAMWAAVDHLEFRGQLAVAKGWFARARRLLDGLPLCVEHGWLALHDGAIAVELEGDPESARQLGADAVRIGRELGDVEVETIGLALEGLALVLEGDVANGLRQLDEAAAAALGGELPQPVSAGWACCYVIYACEDVRDYERAAQWCEETRVLAERLGMRYLFRVCRTHLGGVLIGHGAWAEAEAELSEATGQLLATRPAQAVEGIVRLAELRRRQGRRQEARELFEQAEPHLASTVGLATLALEDGHAREAAEDIARALRQIPARNRTARSHALEILVQAHAAMGALPDARAALVELERLAQPPATDHLQGAARFCAGIVASLAGDSEGARDAFEEAVSLFGRSRSPYESALSRIALGETLLRLGRRQGAERELRRAAEALERLGAASEAARARRIEHPSTQPSRLGLTPREIDVLRLVAAGMTDRDVAARLVLSEHTVHRHVANIRTKLRASSRAEAVAAASREGLV